MTRQTKFKTFAVIEYNGVVGIVCGWDGNYCRIMFEDGKNGVDFATYGAMALDRFTVIG